MEPEISVFLLEFKKAFLLKPPWWPSVKNLPGNRSLIPSPGTKIPHAVGQLNLSLATNEALRPQLESLLATTKGSS